jgi:hypothetical protein
VLESLFSARQPHRFSAIMLDWSTGRALRTGLCAGQFYLYKLDHQRFSSVLTHILSPDSAHTMLIMKFCRICPYMYQPHFAFRRSKEIADMGDDY